MSVLLICFTFIIGIISFFLWKFKHWKTKGIPYENPYIPFGTMSSFLLQTESVSDNVFRLYKKAKKAGHKHYGLFAFFNPVYLPVDLQLIKHIMGMDFNHFVDRGLYHNERDDPLTVHLFNIEGQKWRNLRAKLTPTFTSGKMKMMFATFVDCAENLKKAMDDLIAPNKALEMRDILGRFTTDVIGSCAFGLECNSFENPNSDFRTYSKKAFEDDLVDTIKNFLIFSAPKLARLLRLAETKRDVTKFFLDITRATIEYREKNNVKRNDFLQLLIDLKDDSRDVGDDSKVMKGLTFEEIAAQLFLFFIAGFDTSSTTMTFCLYELAANPDIQEKLRAEIITALEENDGKVTYDAIVNMKYMEQVISETLRKYPALGILNRRCVKDYTIPGTNDVIEKGTSVFISVFGVQRDPDYYPNPENFDPERFSEENKAKIVSYSYLPFGEGPRNCIGLRFGKLQVKVGLTMLLRNFVFSLDAKTSTPFEFDPKFFISTVKGGVWLNVSKI